MKFYRSTSQSVIREKQREQLQKSVACGERLKEVVAFRKENTN